MIKPERQLNGFYALFPGIFTLGGGDALVKDHPLPVVMEAKDEVVNKREATRASSSTNAR